MVERLHISYLNKTFDSLPGFREIAFKVVWERDHRDSSMWWGKNQTIGKGTKHYSSPGGNILLWEYFSATRAGQSKLYQKKRRSSTVCRVMRAAHALIKKRILFDKISHINNNQNANFATGASCECHWAFVFWHHSVYSRRLTTIQFKICSTCETAAKHLKQCSIVEISRKTFTHVDLSNSEIFHCSN